jgi:hypothetical protein
MANELMAEGIYLETKKNIIGTGSTAKVAEYRNFWATLKVEEALVEMILLDDSFHPTGIREKFTTEVLSGPNWLFVEQGEKKYRQLRPRLDSILSPSPPKPKPMPPNTNPLLGGSTGSIGGKKILGGGKKDGWWNK